ncbi:hypothetical protein MNQ98_01250 [Paenibacillus sp. N3/727]|uniref:hypothetical protein n=1 Tax=Paenibacillus sp. N3/727 TaxID=2925845 RepID=UPI001F5389B5|nr:hypothetical protein [Paenibacillus sp. N3/727]UNK18701.1 hypothetical protein MNQ98_01250 [Paenibacillus sp. N3/727]
MGELKSAMAEEEDKQLIEAIIEKMQREQPRAPIIKALVKSLSDSWTFIKMYIVNHCT